MNQQFITVKGKFQRDFLKVGEVINPPINSPCIIQPSKFKSLYYCKLKARKINATGYDDGDKQRSRWKEKSMQNSSLYGICPVK